MNGKGINILRRASLYISALAMGFVMLIVLPSLSWFDSDTSSPININGNVHGSYFESGTGSAGDPFEIARPIQLYYLSWLQEMGYFNEVTDVIDENTHEVIGTELKQQYHFYLSKDIDMAVTEGGETFTYEIPPIGTSTYPFIGSFDGKGHTIKNLTITNDRSEYTNDPYDPNKLGTPGPGYEVLGMFGVLGTTNTGDDSNKVHCAYTNEEGKLVQYATDVEFDPTKTVVKNFYLDTVTVSASTDMDHALIGVVAGYANAPISGVGIKGATLNVASSRQPVTNLYGTSSNEILSQYTALGYASSNNHRNVKYIDEDVYAPKATQSSTSNSESGDAWGGSIEFESMLERIHKSRNLSGAQSGSIPEYVNGETVVKDTDGKVLKTFATSRSTATITNGGNKNVYYKQDDNIGAYYFKEMTASGDKKVYLEGYSDIDQSSNNTTSTYKTIHTIQKTNQTVTAYYIKDTNGRYIGTDTNGNITYNESNLDAVKWHYNADNHDLFCLLEVGEEYKYLHLNCNSDDVFSVSDTNTTNWQLSNGEFIYATSSGSGDSYQFNISNATGWNTPNTKWNTKSGTGTTATWQVTNTTLPAGTYNLIINCRYTSSDHSDRKWYNMAKPELCINGVKEETRTSSPDTTSESDYRYWLTVGNTVFNPTVKSSWGELGMNNTNNVDVEVITNVVVPQNTTTIAMHHGNIGFSLYVSYIRFEPLGESKSLTPETTLDNGYSESDQKVRGGQAGYVPLSVDGDSSKFLGNATPTLSDYNTKSSNTGYVVGGYYDRNNGGAGFDSTYTGDVRFAAYAISNISNSYSTSTKKISNISTYGNIEDTTKAATSHTINSSEYTGTGGGKNYKKLADSISKLETTLDGKSYVYGIHFMDSVISMDHIITAPKAVINGATYTNYQLPEDSIDFSLKEKGYINFFAGDYQNNNDAFFSLHEIIRDESGKNITAIKEIKYVYAPSDGTTSRDYIYEYANGGGYSTTGVTANGNKITKTFNGTPVEYTRVFDTAWIGKNGSVQPKGNNLWYFEVPVNKGEFALGSVNGACGGYLVYLDISAAAQTVERKEVTEYYEKETLSGDIANGIQFVDSIPDPTPTYIKDESGNPTKDIDKTKDVRENETLINDLDSYSASMDTSGSGNYVISRSNDNISISSTAGMTTQHIGDGLTLNGSSQQETVKTIVRRITDYDFNTMTNIYVKQVTTVETTGTTNVAYTTIYNCSKDFADVTTEVATFSYTWEGDGPTFAYKYSLSLNTFSDSNNLEVNFETDDPNGITVTLEEINPNFTFNAKGQTPTSTVGTEFIINPTELTYTPDKWYDFEKANGGYTANETSTTPTKLVTFHYRLEGDETITEDFQFVGYSNLASLEDSSITPSKTPTPIDINNAVYTYYFTLTGKDASKTEDVYIWYVSSNTIAVSTGDGSQAIHFYKTTDGNWVPEA